MAYCPECKNHFEPGTRECPEHRIALVDDLPFQTVDGPNTTWIEIAALGTIDEARILQGFLEAEGIPAQIESLKFDAAPVNIGVMGEIRVYVSAENEQEALELLRQRDEEYGQLDDEEAVVTDEGPADIDETAQPVTDNEQ